MCAVLAIMLASIVAWLWGLSGSSADKMKLRTHAPIVFALIGLSYMPTALVLGADFMLSGFVHHEGFVAGTIMWLAPVVGILGCGAALAINHRVSRLAKKPH